MSDELDAIQWDSLQDEEMGAFGGVSDRRLDYDKP